jgi:hypothetical protein
MFIVVALLGFSNFSSDYPVIVLRHPNFNPNEKETIADILKKHPPSKDNPYLFLLTDSFRKQELREIFDSHDETEFPSVPDTTSIFPNQTFTLKNSDCPTTDQIPPNPPDNCLRVIGASLNFINETFWNKSYSPVTVVVFQDAGKLDFHLPNPFTTNVWNAIFVSVFLILLICWAMHKFLGIDVQTRFAKKRN